MTWVATAIIGGAIIGGAATAYATSEAAEEAAGAQIAASEKATTAELEAAKLSIEEQRRQFDEIQALLAPYVSAGETSLTQQMNLIGLGGRAAQEAAISDIEKSPEFEALTRTGEEALLQRASATGGLRGGNIQAALAEYRPSVLSQLIENQYNRLGSLTGMGQASAVGVGSAGQATSGNISNILQSMGAAQAANYMTAGTAAAQSALVKGQGISNVVSGITGSIPLAIYGAKNF